MADKTIGELPAISNVTDGTLIPVEQAGVAARMNGAQFKAWGEAAAQPAVTAAANSASQAAQHATNAGNSATAAAGSANTASTKATEAGNSATAAEASRQAIENMSAEATTLDPGSQATVSKRTSQGVTTLIFGIPQGATGSQGERGPAGPQGVQGPRGDTGTAVAVETQGMYYFNVDNDSSSPTFGHLFLTYTGSEAPNFSINEQGHLVWTVEEE